MPKRFQRRRRESLLKALGALSFLEKAPHLQKFELKDQEALLVLGQEPVCFILLTKAAAWGDLLEKVQEQTGLAFHVGF